MKSGEVDTTKLEAELNNADKVVLDAFEDGKEKAAFEAAYAAAQKVLENPTDQAAVDKAEKDLEDARKRFLQLRRSRKKIKKLRQNHLI